ncbi:hypothetical protein CYMTET_32309 [Cymbomonas tetramitiformis]|uniref:Uncharacterized protein n=1 Tax=Cymbomonas tetramitiformis TaxID=36881 RepID=A0AAE0FFA1_9CHLO|nr:hypothetical protein CYMTET_32309 [Cymbomonas tetramitiformis]
MTVHDYFRIVVQLLISLKTVTSQEECKSGWTIDKKYSSNYVYCVDTTTLHFMDGESNSNAKMSYSLGAYGSGGSMSFNAKYGGTGCCGLTMTFKDSGGNSIGEVRIQYTTLLLDSVDTGFKPDSNIYYSFSVIWSKSEVTSVLYGCNELLSKSISGVPASLEATSGYGSSTNNYWMQFNEADDSKLNATVSVFWDSKKIELWFQYGTQGWNH